MASSEAWDRVDGEGRPGTDPGWVHAILQWRWTWPVARWLLVSPFLVAALFEMIDFQAAVQEQERVGLHPGVAWAVLNLAIQGLGCLVVVSGRLLWLGAGLLAVYTGVTAVMAHQFWSLSGPAAFQARNEFFDDLGLVAGFVLLALQADRRRP